MARITEAPLLRALATDGVTLVNQSGVDYQIESTLAYILSWGISEGLVSKGLYTQGLDYTTAKDFTYYQGKAYLLKSGVALPYTTTTASPVDDPNLSAGTTLGGGEVFSLTLNTVADFATLSSSLYPSLERITTIQHTQDGLGAATYKKVSSGTPDAFGFVVQDASGQLWTIDFAANAGFLFFEQLGALPRNNDIAPIIQKAMQVQNVTGCGLDHEVGDGFYIRSSAGPMLGGDFPTRIKISKTGVIWSARDATTKLTILEAPVSVAEGVQVSGLTMLASLVNDTTIPAYNQDPAGYHAATSWCIDFSRCRNGSNLDNIRVIGGANGIVATDLYYASMSSIDLRGIDPSGIGLFEYAISSSAQVNAVLHTNIKVHNGSPSLACVAVSGVGCDGNTYFLQCENSDSTGAYFQGWRGTNVYPYFENNNPNTTSESQATDLFVRDSEVTLIGGLINSPQTGSADSKSIIHTGSGFVKLDGGLRFRKGGRSSAWDGNIIEGDYAPIGFEPQSGSKYGSNLNGGVLGLTKNENLSYAVQTTLPLALNVEAHTGALDLWQIDFNTVQSREVFTFDVTVSSTEHGKSNAGVVTQRKLISKEGNQFLVKTQDYGEAAISDLPWGAVSTTGTGGVMTITFTPHNSGTFATKAVLHPVMCGHNGRITSIVRA